MPTAHLSVRLGDRHKEGIVPLQRKMGKSPVISLCMQKHVMALWEYWKLCHVLSLFFLNVWFYLPPCMRHLSAGQLVSTSSANTVNFAVGGCKCVFLCIVVKCCEGVGGGYRSIIKSRHILSLFKCNLITKSFIVTGNRTG